MVFLWRSPTPVSVKTAANLLGIRKSGYYSWLVRKGYDARAACDWPVVEEMMKIIQTNPGYGYRKLTCELSNCGIIANHKRVRWLMRDSGLVIKRKRFNPITTDSEHDNPEYPNLVWAMDITAQNQVWAVDFTYIKLKREFVFLAIELDLFSRRRIGWSLSRNLTANTALEALHMALYNRRNDKLSGLVHYSDCGLQSTSFVFTQCLRDHGIQISNSRKGNSYDNAFVESFFKTLKYEEVYLNEYETFDDALKNIKWFIEDVYNLTSPFADSQR